MKEVEFAVKWKCDYCNQMFDTKDQCEAHEIAFCQSRPDLKELADDCEDKWYASEDERKIFKVRYYDWYYGYFVCSCYADDTRILIGYTNHLPAEDVLKAHRIDSSRVKKLIYQFSKDMIGRVE